MSHNLLLILALSILAWGFVFVLGLCLWWLWEGR